MSEAIRSELKEMLQEFKLKKGFRELFGTTVFGYVLQLRMHHARRLLEQGTTVSEAAFMVGYQNVSSFCVEFRKRYGYSPGRIRRKEFFAV